MEIQVEISIDRPRNVAIGLPKSSVSVVGLKNLHSTLVKITQEVFEFQPSMISMWEMSRIEPCLSFGGLNTTLAFCPISSGFVSEGLM